MYDLYNRDENLINLLLAFLIEIVFGCRFIVLTLGSVPFPARDLFYLSSSSSSWLGEGRLVVTKPEMKMSRGEETFFFHRRQASTLGEN
jgi:hypothetical protein